MFFLFLFCVCVCVSVIRLQKCGLRAHAHQIRGHNFPFPRTSNEVIFHCLGVVAMVTLKNY